MLSFGKAEYVPELKALWQKVFGDSPAYLDAFFSKIYKDENTLVFLESGRVVSALYMIPYEMLIGGRKRKVVYLYALATDPDFRGKKIMSELIAESFKIGAERGYVLSVLIPAENSLFGYYRSFGFESCFEQVKITRQREELISETTGLSPAVLRRAGADEIWEAYCRSEFYSEGCLLLSREQNRFYLEELERDGGEALLFSFEGRTFYALLKLTDDTLSVYETSAEKDALKALCAALLESFTFKTAVFYQPFSFSRDDSGLASAPFAMAKKLRRIRLEKPFLNRVLT